MERTIFEQIGGTYSQVGEYCLPDLAAPEEEPQPIGIWGQRRLRYIKKHRRIVYMNLLLDGKLHTHLAEINRQAQEIFFRLVDQMAAQEGVTEQLKAGNQMTWVGRMNNIRERVMEVVNSDLIYT